jgi:multimeric flavodoxin WrbA
MKTVYLPSNTPPYVLRALESAGVEYVIETEDQAKIRELEAVIVALERANGQQCERVEQAEDNAASWHNKCVNLNREILELTEQLKKAHGKIFSLEIELGAARKSP